MFNIIDMDEKCASCAITMEEEDHICSCNDSLCRRCCDCENGCGCSCKE